MPKAAPSLGEPLELDVRQCVEMALRQSAQALTAGEEVAAREAQVGQAKAAYRPRIKTQAGYSFSQGSGIDIDVGPIIGGLFGLDDMGDTQTNTFALTAGVEQVLFSGGQIYHGIKASKFLAASEEWKRQATLDAIEFETKQAFYDTLLARALVGVAEESVTTFERHCADARQMLDVGLVSRFEVLRAETELGARKSDVESARGAAKIAMLNMVRVLALGQDAPPLELVGTLEWTPPLESAEELTGEANLQRAELKALEEGIMAAKQNIKVKWGEYIPKAAASAQYQHIMGDAALAPSGFTATVGVEWDFYAGGRRRHEVREAKAQLRSIEHQRADVQRLVELDVRQAYIRLQEAIAKIRTEKGTVSLGREGLRLAELRFQEGVGTQAETLDAELALTQARTTLAQALRNYAVATAALDKAVGRSWVEREISE